MANKDSVSRQEGKLSEMAFEMKETDETFHEEQLLNLQLNSEHNALMTNLSHILNQRNSLLLESEGLKDTVTLLMCQIQNTIQQVQKKQMLKEVLKAQIEEISSQWQSWSTICDQLNKESTEFSKNKDALQLSIQQIRERVCSSQANLSIMVQQHTQYSRQLEEIIKNMKDTSKKKAQLEKRNMNLQQELTVLNNQHLTLQQEIDQTRVSITEVTHRDDRLHNELTEEMGRQQGKIEVNEKQKHMMEKEISELQIVVDDLQMKKEEMEKKIVVVEETNHQMSNEESKLHTLIESMNQSISSYNDQISVLQSQHVQQQKQHDDLLQQISHTSMMNTKLHQICSQLQERQLVLSSGTIDEEGLQLIEKEMTELEKIKSRVIELDRADKEMKQCQVKNQEMEETCQRLQKKNEDLMSIRSELTMMEKQVMEERRQRIARRQEVVAKKKKLLQRREEELEEEKKSMEEEWRCRLKAIVS